MKTVSPSRRRGLQLISAGLLAMASLGAVQAQTQSPATVRILVGFPPGGGTDAIARLLADKLKDPLGTTVVVENKAGAGGQIAAQASRRRRPMAACSSSRTTTASPSCHWS